MGLSNASLPYLNYPTQVMFKCCKLIPVLIGGILIQGKTQSLALTNVAISSRNSNIHLLFIIIQGKTFNVYDVSASIMMSIGLIFFTLADLQVQPNFQPVGVALISSALCADAAIGNYQEKQMKLYKASNIEVVSNNIFLFCRQNFQAVYHKTYPFTFYRDLISIFLIKNHFLKV